jgi:hypothetical protein
MTYLAGRMLFAIVSGMGAISAMTQSFRFDVAAALRRHVAR